MASMATGAGYLSSLAMDTSLKLISGNSRSQGMLLTNTASEWQRLHVRSMLETCVMDLLFLLGRTLCFPWQS